MTPVCVCTARQLKHETHRHTKYVIIIKWFEFTAPFYTLNKTATFNSGHGVSKLGTQDTQIEDLIKPKSMPKSVIAIRNAYLKPKIDKFLISLEENYLYWKSIFTATNLYITSSF